MEDVFARLHLDFIFLACPLAGTLNLEDEVRSECNQTSAVARRFHLIIHFLLHLTFHYFKVVLDSLFISRKKIIVAISLEEGGCDPVPRPWQCGGGRTISPCEVVSTLHKGGVYRGVDRGML